MLSNFGVKQSILEGRIAGGDYPLPVAVEQTRNDPCGFDAPRERQE